MWKIIKSIIYIFVYLIALELLLQISGFIYVRTKYKIQNQKSPEEQNSLRIMFIGDSWTQGAEAAPKPGYVPLTIEKLSQLHPEKHIEGYNYAYGSTNSSQAVHQFLDHYKKIRPQILVVMTGVNNGWNTQDIVTACKRIRNEIQTKVIIKIEFSEYIVNNFKKLKIVKSYNLILYNLIYKPREIKFPFIDTEYSFKYFQIYNEYKGPEKAREYLIDNYKEVKNYNEFYKLMLHSFGGNIKKTQDYLRNKNMWKPNLIKDNLSIEKDKRYRGLAMEILKENLTDLKLLCDQEDIIMVVENYPHMSSGYRDFNRDLDEIASKIGVLYVNHCRYFEKNIGYKKWEEVMTFAHVNAQGHKYMADNLINHLADILNSSQTR